MIFKKVILAAAILGISTEAFADTTDSWKFEVVPYLWALNMNGNVTVKGASAQVNQTFGDTLKELNVAAMILLSASKGNWSFALNSLYASTSQNVSVGPFSAKVQNKFAIFTPTISYTAYQTNFNNSASSFAISPYVGARTTINDAKLTIDNISVSDNQNWTDPIIGAQFDYGYHNWSAVVLANIGGTSTDTDYSYDAAGYIGYNPTSLKAATFYAGYQYLRQKYTTGSGFNAFAWNMKLFGPVVGVAITF